MQISRALQEEIEYLIHACLTALKTWDRAALARIFADDPTAIHFGTAAEEKYVGGAAYLHAMERQRTKTIPEIDFDFLPGSPVIQSSGDVAWVVGDARLSGVTATRHYFHIDTRITFVLQLRDDRWQIVHSHFSIGVPSPS